MSAQSQGQQVDHGQVVDNAQHVDQAQDVNQAQARITNQANNTAQAAIINRSLFNVVASFVQTGAQKAAAMIPFRTRASSNASSASDESVGSMGPTTPFENEIDEPGIVTPSMYEQESPVIQPQDQDQDEPHPLKRNIECLNLHLLGKIMGNPLYSKEEQDWAQDWLRWHTSLPAMFDRHIGENASEFEFESRSEYGDEGAIYFETGRFHGPQVQAA